MNAATKPSDLPAPAVRALAAELHALLRLRGVESRASVRVITEVLGLITAELAGSPASPKESA